GGALHPRGAGQEPEVGPVGGADQGVLVLLVELEHPVVALGERDPAQQLGQEGDRQLGGGAAGGSGAAEGLGGFAVGVEAAVVHLDGAVLVQGVGRGHVAGGVVLVAHRQAGDLVPQAEVALQVEVVDGGHVSGGGHGGLSSEVLGVRR